MDIITRTHRDYVAEWKSKPYYPEGDGFTWESFLETQKGKTGSFVLTLERGPEHGEISVSRYLYQFIGLFSDREDGKLGTLCIGQGTRDMESDVCGFVYADGLDPDFLHTMKGVAGYLQGLPRNKVTSIAQMDDELKWRFLWQFVRPDANDGMPFNKAYAAGAIKLRNHLHEFFQEWRTTELVELYWQLEAKLKERRDLVEVETTRVRRQLSEIIRQNEEEMALLLNKPL